MNFAENIRQLRKKSGLSQSEFAKLLKVKQPNIPRWESGAVTPSIESIIQIAEILGTSTDEILLSKVEQKKFESFTHSLFARLKKLSKSDQETLLQIIDAFIKSKK